MTNGTGGGDCEGTLHLRRRSRLQVPSGDRSEQEVNLESVRVKERVTERERERERGRERERDSVREKERE